MHPLSLHQVIAPDAQPPDLVEHVDLFTESAGLHFPFPIVQDGEVAGLQGLLADTGVSVLAVTTFPITAGLDVNVYAAGLERGGRLGAKIASVRLFDKDRARAAEAFGRLAALASDYDIELSIEFTGFEAHQALEDALWVTHQTGRGKISLDPLHIVRTGTPIETIRRLDPAMIGYVQFCDGTLNASRETYAYEGGFDRLPPGTGEFPLLDLLALVPQGMPISLEVPQEPARQLGVSAIERCRRAVDGMRTLMSRG